MHAAPSDQPEIATSEDWRSEMKSARVALGFTQVELAGRVGTSQNMISLIESGGVIASQFVLPICRVLKIHPPVFFETDEERRWMKLGRDLRARDPEVFRRALGMVESMVAALEPDTDRRT